MTMDIAQRQALRATMLLHNPDIAGATAKEVLELLDAIEEAQAQVECLKKELWIEKLRVTNITAKKEMLERLYQPRVGTEEWRASFHKHEADRLRAILNAWSQYGHNAWKHSRIVHHENNQIRKRNERLTAENALLKAEVSGVEAKIKAVFNPADGSHIPLYVNIVRGSVDSQALARRLLSIQGVQRLDGWEALNNECEALRRQGTDAVPLATHQQLKANLEQAMKELEKENMRLKSKLEEALKTP